MQSATGEELYVAVLVVATSDLGKGIGTPAKTAYHLEQTLKNWAQVEMPVKPAVDFEGAIAVRRGNDEQSAMLKVDNGGLQQFLGL